MDVVWLMMVAPLTTVFAEVKHLDAALHKTAQQSSTVYGRDAGRAVDEFGVTYRDTLGNIVTYSDTNTEHHPYWEVDLGDTYAVDYIRIYGIAGLNLDVQIDVSVDGQNYVTVCTNPGPLPDDYTCDTGNVRMARWVKLTSVADGITRLRLVKVEVMVNKGMFTTIPSVKGTTGSLIVTKPVVSGIQCVYHCSCNADCMGVNVIQTSSGMECQLLGTDEYVAATADDNVSFWLINIHE